MTAFDPMDPDTWNARTSKTRGPRPRFRNTETAISELKNAFEQAELALSALNDPDYFEKHIRDLEKKIDRPIAADDPLAVRNPPDPEFEAWERRAHAFHNHVTWAVHAAVCATRTLLFAEISDAYHRPPKRRRTARTQQ
jgi:hypothetical protein